VSKKTLKQKQKDSPKGPGGNSRYARKIIKRRRLAHQLGKQDAPLPVLKGLPEREPIPESTTPQPVSEPEDDGVFPVSTMEDFYR